MGFPNIWNFITRPNLTHLATYICVYMFMSVYRCVCVCVCTHVRGRIYIYTHTHTHTHICMGAHTHVCIHVCAYIQLIVSQLSKLRGCRYETIEEMKEAVTKVSDALTQEEFNAAFQKLLEWYNKCIAAGGDYFEEYESFMGVLSIKVPRRKNSGNLFNDPRICECVCVCECEWSN